MNKEKIAELVALLFEGTNAGWLQWEETAKPSAYQASFPHYSIVLDGGMVEVEHESLLLYDEDGQLLDEIFDDSFRTLFPVVRRKALGIDEAIDTILDELYRRKQRWSTEIDELPF